MTGKHTLGSISEDSPLVCLSKCVASCDDFGGLHVSVEHCLLSGEIFSSVGSAELVLFLTRLRKVNRGLNLFLQWSDIGFFGAWWWFISTRADVLESSVQLVIPSICMGSHTELETGTGLLVSSLHCNLVLSVSAFERMVAQQISGCSFCINDSHDWNLSSFSVLRLATSSLMFCCADVQTPCCFVGVGCQFKEKNQEKVLDNKKDGKGNRILIKCIRDLGVQTNDPLVHPRAFLVPQKELTFQNEPPIWKSSSFDWTK
jgi:hypothetical protein